MQNQKAKSKAQYMQGLSKLWFFLLFFNIALNFACYLEVFESKNDDFSITTQEVCQQTKLTPFTPTPDQHILFANNIIGASTLNSELKIAASAERQQGKCCSKNLFQESFKKFIFAITPNCLVSSESLRAPPQA